ncbi:MAG: hypothetical protein WCX30_01645 [Candidatus Paceibacterota bacterium]|jgi:hypothetical protein|nr:hypothetical protein [bacterium]
MEHQLKFEPTNRKEGVKYKPILITDILFHASHRKATTSLGKKIKKSFETGNPGRIYSPIVKNNQPLVEEKKEMSAVLDMLSKDPDFIRYVEEEREKGYEVTVQFPITGLPLSLAKDAEDFVNSKNAKRIFRKKLAKNKDKDI